MERWQRKLAFLRFFSALPMGDRLLDAFRYRFGSLRKHNLDHRWYSIEEMLRMVRGANIPIRCKHLAEIGSGWHPLLAPMFYGMGAASIRMTDISPHVRTEFVERTVSYLIQRGPEIAELAGMDVETLEKRWRELLPKGRPWDRVFADHGITYEAPLDFTRTGWIPESVELVYSNSCLGYIPPPVLSRIFAESFRLLQPGGFFAHNIDPVDVLTGTLNYLKFSAEEWERIGNCKLHYQSRLRPADYIEIARTAGFEVAFDERTTFPKSFILDRSQLHEDFRNLPDSELLCFHMLFVGKKPARAS